MLTIPDQIMKVQGITQLKIVINAEKKAIMRIIVQTNKKKFQPISVIQSKTTKKVINVLLVDRKDILLQIALTKIMIKLTKRIIISKRKKYRKRYVRNVDMKEDIQSCQHVL